jgi:hypothetical protein
MTTPRGYPDFQTYPQWRSSNLLNALTFLQPMATGNHDSGFIPVSEWSHVSIRLAPTSGAAQVTITWGENTSLGVYTNGSDHYDISSTSALFLTQPTENELIRVQINVTSAASMNGDFFVRGANNGAGRITFPIFNNVQYTGFQSLAASGTFNLNIPFQFQGPATLYCDEQDGAQKLDFQLLGADRNGFVLTEVARVYQPLGVISLATNVPCMPLILRIVNNDAAGAHNFESALWLGP